MTLALETHAPRVEVTFVASTSGLPEGRQARPSEATTSWQPYIGKSGRRNSKTGRECCNCVTLADHPKAWLRILLLVSLTLPWNQGDMSWVNKTL